IAEGMLTEEFLRISSKRGATTDEAIQNAAQGIKICRTADMMLLMLDLFRCHVAWCSGSGVGFVFGRLFAIESLVVSIDLEPRQTKIEHVNERRLTLDFFYEDI